MTPAEKTSKLKFRRSSTKFASHGTLLNTLRLFDHAGPLSQTKVAHKLNVSPPAAFEQFMKLHNEGLLVPVESPTPQGRGRPVKLWDIDKARNFTIGFCFIPPMLVMGLGNFGGSVLLQEIHDLNPEIKQKDIVSLLDLFVAKSKAYISGTGGVIRTIHIGHSGEMDTKGTLTQSVNMPALVGLNFKKYFSKKYDITTHCHDHCYTLYWGEGKHLPPNTTLTVVDWDLGLGVVTGCNDQVFTLKDKPGVMPRGIHDIGHMRIIKNGHPCTCGKTGCLEAYTGGWALLKQINRPDVNKISDIVNLAENGDPAVLKILSEALMIMGEQLSWVMRYLGTERIIFTGPLSLVFPIVRHAFCDGLRKFLSDDEIKAINPLSSPDYLSRIIVGSCYMARHLFFYPEAYTSRSNVKWNS